MFVAELDFEGSPDVRELGFSDAQHILDGAALVVQGSSKDVLQPTSSRKETTLNSALLDDIQFREICVQGRYVLR